MQYARSTSSPPSAPVPPSQRVLTQLYAGAFVAEAALMGWVSRGLVRRSGAVLTSELGERFLMTEACRVLGPKRGETDPFGLTGKVETIRELIRGGAVLSSGTIRVGQLGYDLEFGYTLTPIAVDA